MCLRLIPCAGTKLSRRQSEGQGDIDTLRWHRVILRLLGVLNGISISICKLWNNLDCVTSKGKRPRFSTSQLC